MARTVEHKANFIASAAIDRFDLVYMSTTERQVTPTSAITQSAIGIALEAATAASQEISVMLFGPIVPVNAGDAITCGDLLMPEASGSGKVVTLAGATAVGCGVAIMGAADGETIEMVAIPMTNAPAGS